MKRRRCLKWTSCFVVLGVFAYHMFREQPGCALDQPRKPRDTDDFLLKRQPKPLMAPRRQEEKSGRSSLMNQNVQAKILEQLKNKQETLLKYLDQARENEELLRKNLIQLSRDHLGSSNDDKQTVRTDLTMPTVFVITPTFKRFVQKAELTRVSQALKPVKNLQWIVVEDSDNRTSLVKDFLMKSGLKYIHLNVRTPENLQRQRNEYRKLKPRGVVQRNLGISWLRKNIDPKRTQGVVYFADDDNTYDSRIFDEMRWIRGVGVWPVAFTGAARWAGPICRRGKVVGFHVNWGLFRPFPIDMAAFAVNIKKLIIEFPTAQFLAERKAGMLESSLLKQITTVDDLEPVTPNCSKVYVWHTRTEKPKDSILGEKELIREGKPSNRDIET